MKNGVRIVTDLAERITALFDDAGASQVERYSALDVARALVPISEASVMSDQSYGKSDEAHPGSISGDR
jgi:hypothetical protein